MYKDLGRDAYPAQLLDDYLAAAGPQQPAALAATALRTGSLGARLLLARAAAGDSARLTQLIVAARRRRAHTLGADLLDPAGLAELARVIALQDLLPDDRADGLALYELALEMFGPDQIPPHHQGFHVQLALSLGEDERTRALLAIYPAVPDRVRAHVGMDLANPYRRALRSTPGGDLDGGSWLRGLSRLLPEPGLILVDGGDLPPFDRLVARSRAGDDAQDAGSDAEDLVSVVVTGSRPGAQLITALRSLLAQSWGNLEVLLVDDGASGQVTRLRAAADLDRRIRIVAAQADGEPCLARNAGLAAATGRFVTFQDGSGWSHPMRIERQVRPLLEDASLVATISDALRVTERLALTVPGRDPHHLHPASLTFRREPVLSRLGYLDRVRRGAGIEYLRRVQAVFGDRAVRHLGTVPNGLTRDPATRREAETGGRPSLPTAAVSSGPEPTPAQRDAYRSAYQLWHEQIRNGLADPYLTGEGRVRRFPAPAAFLAGAARLERYDVGVAGDWRTAGATAPAALAVMRALVAAGRRVAVLHLDSYGLPSCGPVILCRPVQRLVNAGQIDQIFLSDWAEVGVLLVWPPQVLQFAPRTPGRVRVGQVMIVADRPPPERDGTAPGYVRETCASVARWLFGSEPVWAPPGTELFRLATPGSGGLVAAARLPADSVTQHSGDPRTSPAVP